ncbi:MAG: GNAT family N-acetyltransferase [Bacteroidota bacterium]|nr:GNAT family N-acetyltransferase [Bacteroidota bacterium]
MLVQHNKGATNGVFFIEDSGKQIASMRYVFAGPEKFIIEHTEVNAEYEGKGLGKLLVKAGVEFAREKGLKILPLCPYAKVIFQRTPEYADVLFI